MNSSYEFAAYTLGKCLRRKLHAESTYFASVLLFFSRYENRNEIMKNIFHFQRELLHSSWWSFESINVRKGGFEKVRTTEVLLFNCHADLFEAYFSSPKGLRVLGGVYGRSPPRPDLLNGSKSSGGCRTNRILYFTSKQQTDFKNTLACCIELMRKWYYISDTLNLTKLLKS